VSPSTVSNPDLQLLNTHKSQFYSNLVFTSFRLYPILVFQPSPFVTIIQVTDYVSTLYMSPRKVPKSAPSNSKRSQQTQCRQSTSHNILPTTGATMSLRRRRSTAAARCYCLRPRRRCCRTCRRRCRARARARKPSRSTTRLYAGEVGEQRCAALLRDVRREVVGLGSRAFVDAAD